MHRNSKWGSSNAYQTRNQREITLLTADDKSGHGIESHLDFGQSFEIHGLTNTVIPRGSIDK